jgi:hypothetical protein
MFTALVLGAAAVVAAAATIYALYKRCRRSQATTDRVSESTPAIKAVEESRHPGKPCKGTEGISDPESLRARHPQAVESTPAIQAVEESRHPGKTCKGTEGISDPESLRARHLVHKHFHRQVDSSSAGSLGDSVGVG